VSVVVDVDGVFVRGRLRVPHLSLTPGVVVVVGENGAGKSTLLDVLCGRVDVDAGRVVVRGVGAVVGNVDGAHDLAELRPQARARLVASLAQEPPPLPDLTVAARIAMGLMPRRGVDVDIAADDPAVVAAARAVDVVHLLSRRMGALSGGERRRAHLARALVDVDAAVVVVDEPFAGLDAAATASAVAALRARAATSVVVVSVHDVAVALALGGRLLGLKHEDGAGVIVVDGPLPDALKGAAPVWGDVKVVDDGDYVGVLVRRR
jgi:ABC-type cobalamin/Fe3+-siderophores transport system ATPase subunit